MTRLVVVGHGMVGARFVEELFTADVSGRYQVTVLGAEEHEPYNRVLLSEVVAGTRPVTGLALPTVANPRLRVLHGRTVETLDREDRVVVDDTGARHRYDQLVLATGAQARQLDLPGLTRGATRGVHVLRSLDDARELIAATLNARRAIVLGAGVLGLEAASALAQRGVHVTVVHPAPALMERQLDAAASDALRRGLDQVGVEQRIGVGARRLETADGAVTGMRLTDETHLAAELLVLSVGTVVDTSLAARAGLVTDRGIVVDAAGRCPGEPRVFAIGDCAQPPTGGTGLVAQGWQQAADLARRLTAAAGPGNGLAPCGPTTVETDIVRLKAVGLDVVTMGICGSRSPSEPGMRTLRLSDPDVGRHVELVVDGDRLVGATCVGAGSVAADLVAIYTRRLPVPRDPAHLLVSALAAMPGQTTSDPGSLPDDATVCRCNGVTAGEIRCAAGEGARDVASIASRTRATTGCGGCVDDVRGVLETTLVAQGEAIGHSPPTSAVTTGKQKVTASETRGS